MDRSPVSNVTLHVEMMWKTKSDFQLKKKKKKKTHAESVLLIPQLKLSFIKRNEKVTEWLSLDLLGRLLQMCDWDLQAWFHGFKQEMES